MITIYQDHNQKSRVGHFTVYLEIAIDHYLESRSLFEKCSSLDKDKETITIDNKEIKVIKLENLDDRFSLGHRLRKSEIQSLIFLVMFYEAFFCEIAITELGFEHFKKIDKIKGMSKWGTIIKSIYGNGLDEKSKYYQYMCSVINTRNELIHYKSSDTIDNQTDVYFDLEKAILSLNSFWTALKALDSQLFIITESIFPKKNTQ